MSDENLPIPQYDALSVADLQTRIRSLDPTDLQTLLAYEREHAARPALCQALEQRLEEVRHGATPSSGEAAAVEVDAGPPSPPDKASPQTEGPPQNPPSQGVPTNPAQPRR